MKVAHLFLAILLWSGILFIAYLGEHGCRSLSLAVLAPGLLILLGAPLILFIAVYYACARRWREAALCVAFALFVFGSTSTAFKIIDIARLHLFKTYYEENVAFSFSLQGGKIRLRSWGGSGFAGSSTIYTLVYDEVGEISKPVDQRSEEWRRVVEPSLERMIVPGARHVHYGLTGYYSVIISII